MGHDLRAVATRLPRTMTRVTIPRTGSRSHHRPTPSSGAHLAAGPTYYKVLSRAAIVWAAVVLVSAGVGLAVWLLLAFGDGEHASQLDAIKTAGTFVAGGGAAAALALSARRQQVSELALNQKYEDQLAAERAAAAAERDAESRRITELYTKAVEQLGSPQAPVRLGGIHALARVAQDNPGQRQTIVDVLCAYLRMPYDLPAHPPRSDVTNREDEVAWQHRVQERQVRLTAQRVLASHLRSGPEFWDDIDLDLTDAALDNVDFSDCHVRNALFIRTRFMDGGQFTGAWFRGDARFTDAEFAGDVRFGSARFGGGAWFVGARFAGDVWFRGVEFVDDARFTDARFGGDARFVAARFGGDSRFNKTEFSGDALFNESRFTGDVWFDDARFSGDASFRQAQFDGDALFGDAQVPKGADFRGAQLGENTRGRLGLPPEALTF